jgi:O-succinylbenzoate synthase
MVKAASGDSTPVKIDRLDVKLLRLPLAQFFETSFGRSYEKSFLLIRLEGEGHVGWGESVAEGHPYYSSETTETTWHIITEFLAQRVVGKTF